MAKVVRQEETVVRRSRGARALRLLVVLGLALALLLLALIGGVHLVLISDIPRARIVHELQTGTGLRIDAAASRTRWGGTTELRDVSIALPLEAEPFVRIDRLSVRHTPVLGMVRGVEVHEATLDRPLLQLRQDDLGRWNVMRAIEIVQARQPDTPPQPGVPPLPHLELRDGVLELPDREGQTLAVPFRFEGVPETPLSWAFTLALGDVLRAAGRVAPHGTWQHQVEASFGADQEILAALLPEQALPLRGDVQWRGALDDGQFAGRLTIERVQAGEVAAQGDAAFSAGNGRVVVRPRGLALRSVDHPDLHARIASGSLQLEGATARLHRLRMEIPGTLVEIYGQWELEQETGELTFAWTGAGGPVLAHQGEATLHATLPEIGAARMSGEIVTSGRVEEGTWDASLNVSVRGASWQEMIGELTATRLVWRDTEGIIDASGTSARVETHWPMIKLSRAVLPGAQRSRLDASLDMVDLTWSIEAEASQWDIPRMRGGALDLRLSARGDAQELHVPELVVAGEFFEARASGDYNVRRTDPLRAAARVAYRRPGDPRGRPAAGRFEQEPAPVDVGAWLAHAQVAGGLRPLSVELAGMLQASDVRVGGAPVPHLSVPFTGRAHHDGGQFATSEFEILGGTWQIQGSYVDDDRSVALQLDGESVPIQSVAELLDVPLQMPGIADGQVQVLVPGLNLDATEIHGSFGVADIDHPHLRVDHGRGELITREGVLTLRGLRLTAGDATIEGSLVYDLRRREDVQLQFESRAWPFSFEGVPLTAIMDGGAQIAVNLDPLTFHGRLDAAADVMYIGQPLGRLTTRTVLEGRHLNVQEIEGDFCQGSIAGRGMLSLDDWRESRGELFMDAVDLSDLMHCFLLFEDLPVLDPEAAALADGSPPGQLQVTPEDFTGTVSGELMLGPAVDPRAPEPLALRLQLRLDDAAFRTIALGDVDIGAYFGPQRSVLERASFEVAGGLVSLWSRLSRHNDETFVHMQTQLVNIDIDQLYRAFEPEQGPLPGRLSGIASFGGYAAPPHRLFGDGRFALVDSDLANIPAVATIYNMLNLRIGAPQPQGRGEVHMRLEGWNDEGVLRDALELTRIQYFNRGVDITAALRIDDVWLAGDSPLSGVAAGTIRPLRDVDIPLLDLDRLITGLQAGAASVELHGTLADREVRVVPFADISARMGRILGAPLN